MALCEPVEVGCRGFAGQCLHPYQEFLGICKGVKPSKTSGKLQKSFGSRGVICCDVYLETSQGLITPSCVAQVMLRHETPNDQQAYHLECVQVALQGVSWNSNRCTIIVSYCAIAIPAVDVFKHKLNCYAFRQVTSRATSYKMIQNYLSKLLDP